MACIISVAAAYQVTRDGENQVTTNHNVAIMKHITYKLPYKANHSRGKTFAVFAVDQATAKVFPQTKYSPVIGVHTS